MRILHVAHGWPPSGIGGTELYAAALASAQQRAGHDVDHWVPNLPAPVRFEQTFARAEANAAFAVACARSRPDVVHIHHLTGASLDLVHLAPGAIVVTLHDYWLGCARGQLVDRWGARCAGPEDRRCARCLAPALWAPLPAPIAERLPARIGAVRARRAAFTRLVGRVRFLTPSRHVAERLGVTAEYLPLPLLHPIGPARAATPGAVRILFVGALIPTKGPRVAVEAFARLPAGAATLTVVGPSPPYDGSHRYSLDLARRIAEMPGARLVGAIPPGAMEATLHAHDVFVFPSTWDENSPLVLREAAAAGLRVVASDIQGVTEVLGDAGVRVEPGSVEALRRALAAEVAGGRARAPVQRFSGMDEHAARVLAAYATVSPHTR